MGDALMDGLSDAGSIPARSSEKPLRDQRFFVLARNFGDRRARWEEGENLIISVRSDQKIMSTV